MSEAWAARSLAGLGAAAFLFDIGGVASLALWLYGVIGVGGWLALDTADNWRDFLLGVGLLGLAWAARRASLARAS